MPGCVGLIVENRKAMETRLSRICDAIIEAGWLAALIVTPLFFNTFSNRVFEPDKLHLLRSIALLMAVVWIIQLLDGGRRGAETGEALWPRLRRTPLVLPTLILLAAYALSTVLSIAPRISLLGSYVRLQGTFTFFSYVMMFAVTLTHLRTRAQVNRIIHAIILTSLPIAIYALMQHWRLDPLPWGGDTTSRVAANMGNAIFVAAYLLIAVFLTLERLVNSATAVLSTEQSSTADALRAGAYLFVLMVQLVAIVFTQSRGPEIGLAAGLYVFLMLGVLLLARWAGGRSRALAWLPGAVRPIWVGLIGLSLAGLAFLIVFNLDNSPLASLRRQPYIGRMGTLFSLTEGTNAVRVLIWEGVVNMMLEPHPPIATPDGQPDRLNAIRPLIGYGPESMWMVYNRFYPPDLAHYEARNASPDRSHNETFDTLVRTGIIGFGAQLFLYVSIFYYSLRWMGLMRGRGRRNLFLALVIGGAVLGVLVPLLADHSPRLAGIGLPAGLIIGIILYITADVWLSPPDGARATGEQTRIAQPAPVALGNGHGDAIAAPTDATTAPAFSVLTGERQLLVLALFSAIVAHFLEIHLGIAIAATLTHFWILSAVLVVVGTGRLDEVEEAETALLARPEPQTVARQTAGKALASATASATAAAARPGGKAGSRPTTTATAHTSRPATRSSMSRERADRRHPWSPTLALLPYAGIALIITMVLVWDYVINQTGGTNALGVLWDAFTKLIDPRTRTLVGSPMLLVLVGFTWLIGGLLALVEIHQERPTKADFPWGKLAAIYAATVVGTFFIYGLIEAGRVILTGMNGMDVFWRLADHIVAFDVFLLLALLALAGALWLGQARPRPALAFRRSPALSLTVGGALTIVALVVIYDFNIQIVRADTLYKQGLAFESSGQWESAIVLYNEAAKLEPKEDFYYLFLGRALLEFSNTAQPGNATLPVDVSKTPTDQLLTLAQQGLQSRTREDLLRATNAILVGAQRLNPLNTDHTANLARLYRSWAFANLSTQVDVTNNGVLRQLVANKTQGIDTAKLDQSVTYYKEATQLSPQNAQLWDEMAAVQYIQGSLDDGLASLQRSIMLDQRFAQTYLLQGDLLVEKGHKAGALAAYKKASALQPGDTNVLGAVGVYSAQTGDAPGALAAFDEIISRTNKLLTGTQTQLTALDTKAQQAGGADKLSATDKSRQQALQNSVASYKSQLYQAYQNKTLVLRDAKRTGEALDAARLALSMASEAQKPTIQQVITDLQKSTGG
jgi:tetratricopeptide (TPR) repeat protein